MSLDQKTRDLLQLALKYGAHEDDCLIPIRGHCSCGLELWQAHVKDELHDRSEKHHRENRKQLLRKRF